MDISANLVQICTDLVEELTVLTTDIKKELDYLKKSVCNCVNLVIFLRWTQLNYDNLDEVYINYDLKDETDIKWHEHM